MIKRIKKRDGQIVNFGAEKIAEQFLEPIPGAEDVQDIVERAFIDEGYSREARA